LSQFPSGTAAAPAADAQSALPRFSYETRDAAAVLAETDVVAAFGFGAAAPLIDDPRWLRIGLEPLTEPLIEVWRTPLPIESGHAGRVRWSRTRACCRFAIELDEADHGGLAGAAEEAYRELGAFIDASRTPHVLRLWNYLDAINLGAGDAERYRLFCAGRMRGLTGWRRPDYPAATAIGRRDGARVLQVFGLAAGHPGTPLENPRQTSAWRYPREYGPTPPAFARAMLAPDGQLLISGTAAVVGHASRHRDDLVAQFDETTANLASLLAAAGSGSGLGSSSLLKVYIRNPADAPRVLERLRAQVPGLGGLLALAGDVCRSELLVEIDGVHAGMASRAAAARDPGRV
jgi:chorismate lyase/3-hydroxybenzoate synthase